MHNLQDSIRETARLVREAHRQLPGPKFLVEHAKLVGRMFPYGYARTLEQIQAGDGSAIEFGLVFVEVQPYFFRSQYIRTLLIRLLKQARLSMSQAERLKQVLELDHEKKLKRKSCAQSAAEAQRGGSRQLR